MYKEYILSHYKNPSHYGKIDNPSITQQGVNPSCGDEYTVYIETDGKIIQDIKFDGEGCAISQASGSILLEEIIGKELEEVSELDTDDMIDLLGIEVNPMRIKCAVLVQKTVQEAIEEFSSD